MEIPKVTITYDTVCPITDKPIHREFDPSQLSVQVLHSMYSDVDNGYSLYDNFRCPHCERYHEITLYKDNVCGYAY